MNSDTTTSRGEIIRRIIDRAPLRRQGEMLIFIDSPETSPAASRTLFDALREHVKKYSNVYPRLIEIFSPVLPSLSYKRSLSKTLARYDEDAAVLNLGSGPGRVLAGERVVNVDLFPMPGVDIVADLGSLPIRSESVDLLLSIAVLEHVPDPGALLAEMMRILRPGGEIFCFVPFLQPFHAAPYDYSRLTKEGLRHLFSKFEVIESGIGAGPVSAFLWTMQHALALALSLGSVRAYSLLFPFIMAATWPLKYLDRLLDRHPKADDIASGFYLVAKK